MTATETGAGPEATPEAAEPTTDPETDPMTHPTTDPETAAHRHGYISDKTKYRNRLRRLEGQVRGIDRMVADERYCIDILTQISAVTKALENVALGLLEDHLRHCVVDAVHTGGETAEHKLTEASEAIARLVRS
ncbi:DNA-binding transcriptional regulator, FrmR family [Leucobacter chromiiresistens]|uniref:DNA-binding transcriptional regulator, FrmR family n=2 Tax=Leucobacter chromiiresistens TaxID=1079994 RepID=A0A1H0ZAY7_9MICO|nr:DNA-binding transcriptional regulator, FrmR family [Leucobacter chromiiresistens]